MNLIMLNSFWGNLGDDSGSLDKIQASISIILSIVALLITVFFLIKFIGAFLAAKQKRDETVSPLKQAWRKCMIYFLGAILAIAATAVSTIAFGIIKTAFSGTDERSTDSAITWIGTMASLGDDVKKFAQGIINVILIIGVVIAYYNAMIKTGLIYFELPDKEDTEPEILFNALMKRVRTYWVVFAIVLALAGGINIVLGIIGQVTTAAS